MKKQTRVAATTAKADLSAHNLVTSWKWVLEKRGIPLVDGIEQLNAANGRKFLHHHISRMETGERSPGNDTADYMMRMVLPELFKQHGLPEKLAIEFCDYLKVDVAKK